MACSPRGGSSVSDRGINGVLLRRSTPRFRFQRDWKLSCKNPRGLKSPRYPLYTQMRPFTAGQLGVSSDHWNSGATPMPAVLSVGRWGLSSLRELAFLRRRGAGQRSCKRPNPCGLLQCPLQMMDRNHEWLRANETCIATRSLLPCQLRLESPILLSGGGLILQPYVRPRGGVTARCIRWALQ